jgi:uncharacterized DUF497 family protein
MEYEWDEAKRLANLKKHGVDFADIYEFDWTSAHLSTDDSKAYGEERIIAVGPVRGRLHVLVYTERNLRTRIISFRQADKREVRRYEEEKN